MGLARVGSRGHISKTWTRHIRGEILTVAKSVGFFANDFNQSQDFTLGL